jgi:hypothetical protein
MMNIEDDDEEEEQHTLLSAPRAAKKGWVGAIQIPNF